MISVMHHAHGDEVTKNSFGAGAGYEDIVGSKTTARLLNSLWSLNYGKLSKWHAYKLPLERDIKLIVSRGEQIASNYHTLRERLKASKREVQTERIQISYPYQLSDTYSMIDVATKQHITHLSMC